MTQYWRPTSPQEQALVESLFQELVAEERLKEVLEPFVGRITLAVEAWARTEKEATRYRLALGREVGKAIAATAAAGFTSDQVQPKIMEIINKIFRIEWRQLLEWSEGSVVEDSLPERLRNQFSTLALLQIGRIPEQSEEGTTAIDRVRFAEQALIEGATSVRDLRQRAEQALHDPDTWLRNAKPGDLPPAPLDAATVELCKAAALERFRAEKSRRDIAASGAAEGSLESDVSKVAHATATVTRGAP